MVKQVINNSEAFSVVRGKLNSNFDELYTDKVSVQAQLDSLVAPKLYEPDYVWVPKQSRSLVPVSGAQPRFTRASTGMYMDASGVWKSAAVDTPRFHHYQKNGIVTCGGLLMESARTNLFVNTSIAAWTANNLSVAAATSPDGTNNAWAITESTDGAATYHRIYTGASVTNGNTYTFSLFYKPVGRVRVHFVSVGLEYTMQMSFDTSRMYADLQYQTAGFTGKVEALPNGWYRLSLTGPSGATGAPLFQIWTGDEIGNSNYQGDGRLAGYMWCPQVEQGTNASSPILTSGTTVTRAADVCTIADTVFPLEGMMIVNSTSPLTVTNVKYASINDGTANNVISVGRGSSAFEAEIKSAGTQSFFSSIARNYEDNEEVVSGVSWAPTNTVAAVKGVVGAVDTTMVYPTSLTQVEVGKDLNGCIGLIRVFSKQVANDVFVGLTSTAVTFAPNALATRHITRIIFDGNSLTAGSGSTWPNLITASLTTKTPNAALSNVALSAQSTVNMNADRVSQVHPLIVSGQTIVVPWEVSNDIYLTARTARQVVDELWTYCDAVRSLGAKVLVATPTPRSGGSVPVDFESRRQSACTLMRNEWQSHGDAFIDVALDTTIGIAGAELNATYYSVEGDGMKVHLTPAGQAILGNLMLQGILLCANADSYTDYPAITLTDSIAKMYREYTFAGYEASAPASRIRFNCTYPEVQLLFTTNTPDGSSFNGIGSVLVNGVEVSQITFPASSGSPLSVTVQGSGNRLIEVVLPFSRHVQFTGAKAFGVGSITKPTARPTKKYVVMGDSTTHGYSASRAYSTWYRKLGELKNATVINYGYGSLEASSLIDIAPYAARHRPDGIIIIIGANHYLNQGALAVFKGHVQSALNALRAILPTTKIYLGGPFYINSLVSPTLTAAMYRTQVQDVVTAAADANTVFVDALTLATNSSASFPDLIHPNDAGSLEIATNLAPLIV